MFESQSPLVRLDAGNQRALSGQFDPAASLPEQARQAPYYGFVEVRLPGARPFLMFSNNDDVVAQHFLYGRQMFEAASLRLWVALARSARTVIDGGAFTGIFSLATRATNPAAQVWAFEPSLNTFSRLVTNIWANRFDDTIAPVMAALGDKKERASIRHPFGLYVLGSGESILKEVVHDAWYEEDIEVIPGDEFEAVRLASPRRFVIDRPFGDVDLIKLDVEGFEPRVLDGMKQLLSTTRPTLLAEFRDDETLRAIEQRLPAGSKVYFVDDDGLALRREPCDYALVNHQNLLAVMRDDLDVEALCHTAGVFLDAPSARKYA